MGLGSMPDTTAAADLIDLALEIPAEHCVLRPSRWFAPDCTQAPYQSGNPIGGLESLVAMAFDLKHRLKEAATAFVAGGIHALCCLSDESRALAVLVENQRKVLVWMAILRTELVNPLDRFPKNPCIETVGVVCRRRGGLVHSDIDNKPATIIDLVRAC